MPSLSSDASQLHLGPDSCGALLTPAEFDAAEFAAGWRYELIHPSCL